MRTNGAPRVVYWNNIPSPYFVRRMNLLAARGVVDIEVWFNERRTAERSWSVDEHEWSFPFRYLARHRSLRLRSVRAAIERRRPDVLVCLYEDTSFALGILAAKTMGIPVAIHAMRTYPSWRARSRIREAAKHVLFRVVDGIQVSGPDSAAYARSYGAPSPRIFVIREEIDLEGWAAHSERLMGQRDEIRSRLGLRGCVFLYVGRLVPEKGVGHLLDAFKRVSSVSGDVSTLALVGDGSHADAYRVLTNGDPGVVFSGFVEGTDLAQWYVAGDVFVFPTLGDPYGHVVQEAMALGLPIISTSAAGDITDRVIDGVTGFLVPPADADRLGDRMKLLEGDIVLRRSLGAAGLNRIQAWDSETWAERFERMVVNLAGQRSRS